MTLFRYLKNLKNLELFGTTDICHIGFPLLIKELILELMRMHIWLNILSWNLSRSLCLVKSALITVLSRLEHVCRKNLVWTSLVESGSITLVKNLQLPTSLIRLQKQSADKFLIWITAVLLSQQLVIMVQKQSKCLVLDIFLQIN